MSAPFSDFRGLIDFAVGECVAGRDFPCGIQGPRGRGKSTVARIIARAFTARLAGIPWGAGHEARPADYRPWREHAYLIRNWADYSEKFNALRKLAFYVFDETGEVAAARNWAKSEQKDFMQVLVEGRQMRSGFAFLHPNIKRLDVQMREDLIPCVIDIDLVLGQHGPEYWGLVSWRDGFFLDSPRDWPSDGERKLRPVFDLRWNPLPEDGADESYREQKLEGLVEVTTRQKQDKEYKDYRRLRRLENARKWMAERQQGNSASSPPR